MLTNKISIRNHYKDFLQACASGEDGFLLTPLAEATPYARCFAIFGLHLLQEQDLLEESRPHLIAALCDEIRSVRKRYNGVPEDKPYRQLLTFTLSALAAINALDEDPLADLVVEQIAGDVDQILAAVGALYGRPQSGNHAMFLAIFLIHARDRLGFDVEARLARWVELHLRAMNRFGFWGTDKGMTHLQFQNGYHQYEILECLSIKNPREEEAVAAVRSLADAQGHFAPYPGGGGCYDYDAVFMLTPNGKIPDPATETLLRRTAATLLSEQTTEGGWGESRYIRPRSLMSLARFASHVADALPNFGLFYERLRYALTLQRPCHNRIHTHWSRYSRRWDEADLWDSWFRMLAVARIECALSPQASKRWGFIDYPGIGFFRGVEETGKTGNLP